MKRSVAISKGAENGRGMYHYLIQSSVFQILARLKLSLCDQGVTTHTQISVSVINKELICK